MSETNLAPKTFRQVNGTLKKLGGLTQLLFAILSRLPWPTYRISRRRNQSTSKRCA